MTKCVRGLLAICLVLSLCLTPVMALSESDTTTIDVVTWLTEDDYVPDVIERFHAAQNDIRVNYTSISTEGDEYNQKLQLMMSSGQNVDIVGLLDVANYSKYYNAGVLEPLDALIEKHGFDMMPYGTLADQMRMGDHYYTLSNRTETYVLFYNKAIFDEMGLPYPEQMTWDEFADLSKKMTLTKEDGSMQYGCVSFAFFGQAAYLYACQYGETIIDDSIPHLRDAYEFAYDISMGERKSSMSVMEMIANDPKNTPWMFARGNVAMYPSGDWTISMYLNKAAAGEMDVDWDIAYLPYPADVKPGTTLGGVTNYAIPTFCENKDAAFEFLSYLCGAEGAEVIASKGTIPAYSTAAAQEAFLGAVEGKNVDPIFDVTKFAPLPTHPRIARVKQVFADEGTRYLMGEIDVDTMLESIEAQRIAILQEE